MTRSDILAWPKAELHSHFDGAMRLETMLDLARKLGRMSLLPADSVEGLRESLLGVDTSQNLEEYLSWFKYTIGLMQDAATLERVAFEMAEDFARENVRWLEVRFGPILHTEEGLSLEQVLDAVLAGLRRAELEYGIQSGIIVCALRDRYVDASVRQAQAAVSRRKQGVIGFDLAGGEAGNPAKQHLAAFYHARNHLLSLTVHAGESWGPDSIRQALFYCGAHRIGHGITAVQDPELVEYLAAHRIPLEICPTSNVQTHVVDSYETHPLKDLLRAGVPVSINTDSRLFSHTSTTDELWLAHTRCGLTEQETRQVARAAFDHAFLPWDRKQELIAGLDDV
ncbi:MAG: adenosine deaminase [Rhodothermales bacterium]